ncbi:PhoH family protein [Candidatus Pelagibacter communis]|uniref:PhoH family protein n=1 Tax=Pelagibacter ubique TaxID=198252 RepID=UPI00094C998D|nr:PhoH family protein [Candidatus Pelagibacter ubique]
MSIGIKKNLDANLKFVYSENNTLSVIFPKNDLLMGVLGEFNQNLKELEKITNSNLYSRGNSILIKSTPDKNEIVKNAIQFLVNQFLINGNIENKDILSSVDKFMIDEKVKNQNVTDIIKTPKKSIIPRSEKQKKYVRALRQSEIIISAGPAGTGKTFLAVAVGLTMLLEKKIERIILSRPAVEAGERLGFLPGDMKEKVDPYLRPLYDSLYDLFHFEKIQRMIEIGDIEIAPLAFMRGRTLKNSFAILDEAQNATDTQIKMFLTRIGENSKIVVNGDPSQIDLPNKQMSGLDRSKKLLSHLNEISIIDFDHSDVVRHPLVSKIVKAYNNNND